MPNKTNFAALDTDAKKVWTREVMHQAREKMFASKFIGKGPNAMIQRITELTKSARGNEAVVTLVPDSNQDGIVGDNDLTGNEATLTAHQDKVIIDQLRQGFTNTGKLTDQKTVVNFRETVRDQLAYWLSDRMDQLFFLTLAGVTFAKRNDGGTRQSQGQNNDNLSDLTFNHALAPTTERHVMVQADGSIVDSDTTAITTNDTLKYQHIVRLGALAKQRYLRGIRGDGGSEVFHLFLNPAAMAELKLDPDFINNARHAGVRGDKNMLWTGGDSYVIDGLIIHEFRHVPTTLGAAAGSKWGAVGDVDGCMGLLCGAQAVGFVDLDNAEWDERDHFDYGNRYGISYGKIFGMKKLQFKDAKATADGTVKQDYGVIRVDMAIKQ
ncbi:N4-gp56 family major capsid protein [Shewanella gaetbuli]|uniref:N4-gp56 family major capsid protein n=1 Tax=Shewanella gaetbuli TaxID=220752 RepID=A0A9X1ZL60_9GAMM|nr:N4-gp56 family major capsid protein [Shewanella gaetbuli]MCL1142977.1 N4-gp56 family major capsid protein [Shewanella gaetbuli]